MSIRILLPKKYYTEVFKNLQDKITISIEKVENVLENTDNKEHRSKLAQTSNTLRVAYRIVREEIIMLED